VGSTRKFSPEALSGEGREMRYTSSLRPSWEDLQLARGACLLKRDRGDYRDP
jgi:hypothetical protein